MATRCSVYGCSSTCKDIKFHRFPRDARCQLWVDACQRPHLKDKSKDQLYNMYICALHFAEWMYMKKKLKSAAIPILNLPPAPTHSITQSDAPKIEITKVLDGKVVEKQVIDPTNGKSVVASTSDQTQPTKKRKIRKQTGACVKRIKLDKDTSTETDRQQFLQACDKFLSPNLSKIAKAQTNLKPHSKNNRYSKEFKVFCLNIYCSSPYAYKFLSKTLFLPSKRSLATIPIPVGTKINDYISDVLSKAIKHLSPIERECTMCTDVIKLNCSLSYDSCRDKITGLHEIDDIQSSYAAGYAFTIMIRCILGNWKQVVGYAFISSSEIDEALKKWIIITVKQSFALGLKIRAIVSNQGPDFLEFSKSMGISKEHPYFEIDGKKIYYIFDVPLLMISVRDDLMKHNFEFNGKTANWADIYKCYELDKQKECRSVPKLTESHVSPKSFQKQKLRLATQVLSNSVKAAVETYAEAGDLNPCNGTVEFVDTMDKLFDLLNSSNLYSPKPYNKPYRGDELQMNLLLKTQNLLGNLIVRYKNTGQDVTSSINFINAFSITINATIQLYDDLKNESGLNEFYLLTRRLNNDSLKDFFGVISQAENCREPTCIQFERAFQRSFLCQVFQLGNKSNCADDLDNILTQYGDFMQKNPLITDTSETHRATQTNSTKSDIPEQNSFMYVCGYLLRRCVDKHKCISIMNYTSSNADKATSNNHILERDGFQEDFVEYCRELEAMFKRNFRSVVGNNISHKLNLLLNIVKFKSQPCLCFPKVFLIKSFIRMRIHQIIQFNNRKLKTCKNKSIKYLALQDP